MRQLEVPHAPTGAPAYLEELLTRVRTAVRVGNAFGARAALQDAIGFLTRYFAYAWAAASPRGEVILQLWSRGSTIPDFEQMIVDQVRAADHSDEQLSQRLRAVFAAEEPHTRVLRGRSISNWMARREVTEDVCLWEVERFLPVLRSWVEAAEPFFRDCMHRYEEVNGRVELASRFDGQWVALHLPLRFRDLEDKPYRTHQADATYRPVEIVAVDTTGLEDLVRQMLKGQEGRPTGEVLVEEAPPQAPSKLALAVTSLGVSQNPFGAPCYHGRIHLQNVGEGPLRGSLHCGHPGLRLSRKQFFGDATTVEYWLDPGYEEDDLAQIHLVVNTSDEEHKVPLDVLLPQSRLAGLPRWVAGLAMMLPGVLGLLYVSLMYRAAVNDIWRILKAVLPESFLAVSLGQQPVPLPAMAALSSLEFEAIPRVSQTAFAFLLIAVLCPLLVSRMFARLPLRTRRRVGPLFLVGMVLPTAGFLVLTGAGAFSTPLSIHPEFAALDLAGYFVWFAMFNLVASAYLFLSQERLLDRWLTPEARLLTPIALWAVFLLAALLLVS